MRRRSRQDAAITVVATLGAAGVGLLLAVAAALAAAGVAAVRFAPRLRGRMPRN
ncbi:hypothetical protein [Streptomyces sp. NBC_01530]|uniref:hypothetical protein n=1 Tax=Streptomyces sp. NBC_01530 TaxID=2903895 RepID=UPI003866CA29